MTPASEEPRMTMDETGEAEQAPRGRRQSADTQRARDTRIQADREAQEREVTEEREITEDERLELFLESLHQSVLPDLPRIPGYHTCWLSTTHQRDTIAWRKRIGYVLIQQSEIPHYDAQSVKNGGPLDGCIMVNEMVAAKLPLTLYNRYMQAVHDRLPQEEANKLRAKTELLKQAAEERGLVVEEGDGMATLANRARPMPAFTH